MVKVCDDINGTIKIFYRSRQTIYTGNITMSKRLNYNKDIIYNID